MRRHILGTGILAILLGAAGSASAQGRILIFNNNLPGVGFNDPTPAAPVGGNPGTTLGQQRTNVFFRAAAIWEEKLNPSVDIVVLAQFTPLGPNVLGSAGAIQIIRDFPGAEITGTWYSVALANHLAGVDFAPCGVPLTVACFDIAANFATTFNFYMGFDNNEGPGQQDLLAVILHEIGHGLGFANFFSETTGQFVNGFPDVYSQYTLDVTTDKIWTAMTVGERVASAINVRKVSWNGINVKKAVPGVLVPGEPSVVVLTPGTLGALAVGDASFGPPLTATGITGDVVIARDAADAAGPLTTDGCSAITNASEVAGKIALMDRGTCGFIVKVKNAQIAGAVAALIADNVVSLPPPGLGGADPTITITSLRISLPDANAIKANLPGVTVTMALDESILAGTDRVRGLMMLAAFNPVIGGSSISHFESIASPNQLMEPAINPNLTSSVDTPQDLTTSLFTDIGWFSDQDGVPDGVDECIGSDIRATVRLGSCDSLVDNVVSADGCSTSDILARCNGGRNHGAYVSCIAHTGNDLRDAGRISDGGKSAIQSCAARNN
jgi:PA domain-containing protein